MPATNTVPEFYQLPSFERCRAVTLAGNGLGFTTEGATAVVTDKTTPKENGLALFRVGDAMDVMPFNDCMRRAVDRGTIEYLGRVVALLDL